MMFASQNGHDPCALQLIEAGANVDQTEEDGYTALMFACQDGHDRVTLQLIEAGGGVNHVAMNGVTALMLACHNGHDRVTLQLIKAGADINKAANQGLTALMIACQNGHDPCVRVLLEKGANLEDQNDNRSTAMEIACEANSLVCVQHLSSFGAKRIFPDDDNAEQAASSHDDKELLNWLIQSREWDPLHHVGVISLAYAEELLAVTPLTWQADSMHSVPQSPLYLAWQAYSAGVEGAPALLLRVATWSTVEHFPPEVRKHVAEKLRIGHLLAKQSFLMGSESGSGSFTDPWYEFVLKCDMPWHLPGQKSKRH